MGIGTDDPRPVYQQVADELRTAILQEDLRAGDRLPSERELARRHGIAQMTARQAIATLRNEGLVDSHHGRGVFVRSRPVQRRIASDRYSSAHRLRGQTPFMVDAQDLGAPRFENLLFGPAPAEAPIADRLGIQVGQLVLVTKLRFHAGDQVMQVSTAYIPYSLVEGTPIADPASQPWNTDTITNLESVGLAVTEVVEDFSARPPLVEEARSLNIRPGVPVFAMARTMRAHDRPLETCDIVMPADRYILSYRLPVT